MTPTEILEKIRHSNALRQKRFYQKHKDKINQVRRHLYKLGREKLKQQNEPQTTDEIQNDYEYDDNNIPLQEPREIITTKDEVRKAIETTEHFKNDSTRRSNKNQLSLIFRATNDEPLMNFLESPEKAKELIENILNLKQKNGNPYALSFSQKVFGTILNIIKIMGLKVSYDVDKVIFNAYRSSKLNYDLQISLIILFHHLFYH